MFYPSNEWGGGGPVKVPINLHYKQALAFHTPATELFFGGAAGPGKSYLMRAAAIIWSLSIPGLQTYLFRRLRSDLIKNHIEGPGGFRVLCAPLQAAGLCKIVGDEIRFTNGSKIFLCHFQDMRAKTKYQGAEIHLLLIDELTHFEEAMYRFLRGRLRNPGLKVPEQYKQLFPRIIASGNPGGIGHLWVKETFVTARPEFTVWRTPKKEAAMLRQFIPAKLEDNPTMFEDDPEYENRLYGLGDETLIRAMRFGEWDIFEGAYFNWRPQIKLPPFMPPNHWTKFTALDWGRSRPFSVGWYAVADDHTPINLLDKASGRYMQKFFPQGAVIRYREWYGCKPGKRNVGLQLEPDEVARGVLQREKSETIDYRVADSAIWSTEGGDTVGKMFQDAGVYWNRAKDKSRVNGWARVHQMIAGLEEHDFQPHFYVTENCVQTHKVMPSLPRDDKKIEDLDTDSEDHIADEIRYALMTRPWIKTPIVTEPKTLQQATMNDIWKTNRSRSRR